MKINFANHPTHLQEAGIKLGYAYRFSYKNARCEAMSKHKTRKRLGPFPRAPVEQNRRNTTSVPDMLIYLCKVQFDLMYLFLFIFLNNTKQR